MPPTAPTLARAVSPEARWGGSWTLYAGPSDLFFCKANLCPPHITQNGYCVCTATRVCKAGGTASTLWPWP